MYVLNLDPTDPTTLEAALETAPLSTNCRVVTPEGEVLVIHRVPGGWYLPGDLVIASGDVVAGQPSEVSLLMEEDYRA